MPTLFVNLMALALVQPCVSGRVLEADGSRAIAGATVSAAWTEIRADKKGVEQIRVARDTTSDASGHYRICAIAGASVLIQVRFQEANAYLIVPVSAEDTATTDLRVATHDEGDGASLTGHVVSEAGAPVPNVNITMLGTGASTRTQADGSFGLRGLPTGSQILIARSIGRNAAVVAVDLSAQTPTTVAVSMGQLPPTLAVVDIVASRLQLGTIYREIGFTQRQRIGNGKYMTQEQIQRRQASDTPELFRGFPGVRVVMDHNSGTLRVYSDRGASTIYNYGECTVYVIDGSVLGNGRSDGLIMPNTGEPVGGPDELMLPAPGDLIGIELYQPGETAPFEVPPTALRCLKIVLWTKALLAGK